MAVKYSTQVREVTGTSDTQFLIHSATPAGATLVKIDAFCTMNLQVGNTISASTFLTLEAAQFGIEVVDTGTGAYSLEANFDDFRTIALHGYGTAFSAPTWPGGTTAGLIGRVQPVEFKWRGSRYYPNSSDVYFAYSMSGFVVQTIKQLWCSVTFWTG